MDARGLHSKPLNQNKFCPFPQTCRLLYWELCGASPSDRPLPFSLYDSSSSQPDQHVLWNSSFNPHSFAHQVNKSLHPQCMWPSSWGIPLKPLPELTNHWSRHWLIRKEGSLSASKVMQSFKLPCSEQLHRSSKTQISQSDRQINCIVLSLDSSKATIQVLYIILGL